MENIEDKNEFLKSMKESADLADKSFSALISHIINKMGNTPKRAEMLLIMNQKLAVAEDYSKQAEQESDLAQEAFKNKDIKEYAFRWKESIKNRKLHMDTFADFMSMIEADPEATKVLSELGFH